MPKIAEAVNAFSSEGVQREAFSALVGAFEGRQHRAEEGPAEPRGDSHNKAPHFESSTGDGGGSGKVPPPNSTKKNGKKTKTVISMDKSLNLSPEGKQSAAVFANAKSPSNQKEKCIVALYYLRDVLDLDKVTTQGVFTFFKTVQWPAPTDMRNTLQQAGTEGWLDTADMDDIKLTSLGENVVEHNLPKPAKA